MTIILPVASGKGGVGKTVFSTNLGISLSRFGKTVILIDLDLGGSNLHTLLGIRNRNPGIGNFIVKDSQDIESLIIETSFSRLFFVPGDSLIPGTANLPYFQKKKILETIPKLVADFIILDLGAGTTFNTIDFFLVSNSGIIITNPETTSILNAYSFLKTAIFRMLYRSFPAKSSERTIIRDFVKNRIEGTDTTYSDLIKKIAAYDHKSGERAASKLRSFLPRIVVNMCRQSKDIALGNKLKEIAAKNLDIDPQYLGAISYDEHVQESVIKRVPVAAQYPGSSFTESVYQIGRHILEDPVPQAPELFPDDDLDISI